MMSTCSPRTSTWVGEHVDSEKRGLETDLRLQNGRDCELESGGSNLIPKNRAMDQGARQARSGSSPDPWVQDRSQGPSQKIYEYGCPGATTLCGTTLELPATSAADVRLLPFASSRPLVA